jgi:hypothetical protein
MGREGGEWEGREVSGRALGEWEGEKMRRKGAERGRGKRDL